MSTTVVLLIAMRSLVVMVMGMRSVAIMLMGLRSVVVMVTSLAVSQCVQRAERGQDAGVVGLHHVAVLDHLVQDDVDLVHVEHDLTAT